MILWPLHAPPPRGFERRGSFQTMNGPAFHLTRTRDGAALLAVEQPHLVMVTRHVARAGTWQRSNEYTPAELRRAVLDAFDALSEQ